MIIKKIIKTIGQTLLLICSLISLFLYAIFLATMGLGNQGRLETSPNTFFMSIDNVNSFWDNFSILLFFYIIIILQGFIIKKYVFNTKPKIKKVIPKVIIPADVTALKELTELDKQQLWQSGKIKDYQSELSEIIRRYTENRFNFIALELATDEILKELEIRLNAEQLANIRTLLQRADLAKFAKSKPNNSENEESMTLAKQFVNNTKSKKVNE